MALNPVRKNKVNLHDYAFREDIERRLFMSELTLFDVKVLQELLHISLTYPVNDLAATLGVDQNVLLSTLDKFGRIKLVSYSDGALRIDKELRKYFEVQVAKFTEDDDELPGFDWIFGVLRKLPIHVLPDWYSIPRITNDIFRSIMDHYLLTPRIYERYLSDLVFPDPLLPKIMAEVLRSPDYCVEGETLRKQFRLERERWEELILYLEFNFVCCLSYRYTGVKWEEVVTPYREWRDYLRFQQLNQPYPISADREIQGQYDEFTFVKDMTALLKAAEQTPLDLLQVDGAYSVEGSMISTWIPHLHPHGHLDLVHYAQTLLDRLLLLDLCEVRKGRLYPGDGSREWHRKSLEEQALVLYRLPLQSLNLSTLLSENVSERMLREMERALKKVTNRSWIYFDDFVQGLTIAVGAVMGVSLKQVGKRLRYEIPQYTPEDISVIRWAIFERLFESGITAVGKHRSRDCFRVTAFGQLALGD